MTGNPNKLSRFWQELKRRRVIHVITVYASASFVLIELVNNLAEPLHLSSNLATILIIILAVGFPFAIILSWLYDLTGEGIEKTKPINEVPEGQVVKVPNAWKIATYISFVFIIGLVVLNVAGRGKLIKPGMIQSLVILPFDNFTGDDQLEFFVSGMHASLIGDMGKIGRLRVIGKTSSNTYKGVNMSVPEIAKELNVDAAVETSVMCLGEDTICLRLQVISVLPEEKQLWVEDFRVAKNEILFFYNEVTKTISEKINIALTPQEEYMLTEARKVDPDAYEAFLKGQYYWEQITEESIGKALEYFQRAIELDPEWADPYAGLANAWGLFGFLGVLPRAVVIQNVYNYLNKALELDPNSAQAHYVKGIVATWIEFDWAQGEEEFLKSIELNPNIALCRLYYAHLLMILRRSEEAVQQAQIGLELDPLKPLVLSLYGVVMVNEGDDQSAIQYFEKALSIDPNFGFAFGNLKTTQLNAHYRNGEYEKWIEAWGEKVKGNWNEEGRTRVLNVFKEEGHIAAIEEMFKMNKKYGNEGCRMTEGIKAERYLYLKNYNKVMDHLEKQFEMRDLNAAYLTTNMYYNLLKDNPRYIELLEKMNLPMKQD